MKKISKAFIIILAVMAIFSSQFNVLPVNVSSPFAVVAQAAKAKTRLNKTKLSLYQGKKYTLKMLDKNGKTIDATKVTWKTANKKIATVSKKGVVTAKKPGKVKITATYKKKSYTSTITVKSTVAVNKKSLTFEPGETSKKSVTVTFKESGTIIWDIVKGDDLITCKWAKDWNNDKTKLYITPTGNDYGTAKVKIYSEEHPDRYVYVNVTVKSPYSLTILNDFPCYISNYESQDYYDKGEKESTVKINKVNYELLYGDSIVITIDFQAYNSYYDEGYYYITYRVLDEDGYVVEFDRVMSERLFIGDKSREEIYLWNLPEGNYTIEFLDHYANA